MLKSVLFRHITILLSTSLRQVQLCTVRAKPSLPASLASLFFPFVADMHYCPCWRSLRIFIHKDHQELASQCIRKESASCVQRGGQAAKQATEQLTPSRAKQREEERAGC